MTTPPVPPREPTVHELHGVRRTDAYAWMREAERLLPHLRAERAYYEAATEHLHHLRGELVTEMSGRVPATDWSVSWRRGAYVYCTSTDEGNEYTRYLRRPLPASESEHWQLVLDENALAVDHFELGLFEVSPSGRVLAYSVDTSGDELYTLRFRSLDSGQDLRDVIERTYYTGAWSADDTTFFYTVPDEMYRPFQVWRHALGTPAVDDVLVWQEDNQQYELTVDATRSGEWIVIATANRTTSEVWVLPSDDPGCDPELLWPRRTGVECEVDHAPGPAGGDWLAVSNDGAVEFQLLSRPVAGGSWSTRVAESADRLVAVHALRSHVVLEYRRAAAPLLAIRGDGAAVELLPDGPAGSIRLSRLESVDVETLTVVTESLTHPPSWWSVDLRTGVRTLLKRQPAPGHDPSAYVEERLWLPSVDVVRVPVTVARRADVPLDGTAPCLLYGYGAYESCLWPEWDAALPSLLDRGVVYAVAHIRGGGEGGRRWWLDGRLESKQNTFTDHLAVADGLAAGLVDGSRLATRGLSAGGLLQGAVFSQRPARWRAVVAEVPFVDVVTTMLDPTVPLTATEWDEWGDPRVAAEFAWMLAYSPYDNLPASGSRPDLLVTGAVHDPRVMVREPAKWVAALRASDPAWGARCVFRVETGAGAHVGPSGRYAHLHYEAEIYAWVLDRLVP